MVDTQHVWALVLAAGDGSRLRALTTQPCGTAVPKQFCSLHGERSLLEDAIVRAGALVAPERICTIVAQQHQRWWSDNWGLQRLPARNLIVQPRNRGTGIGVLYALLHILARDPQARVVLLPADHYVRDEAVLERSLREAIDRVEREPGTPVLMGIRPEEVDPDLGYIVPGAADALGGRTVERFVEKPAPRLAQELVEAGALWNAFILVGRATTLLDMYLPRYASLSMEMQVVLSRSFAHELPAFGWPAIVDLYQRVPQLDFSRDLLEGREHALRVLEVPPCGWSDLGTPTRVGQTVRHLVRERRHSARADLIDLSSRHESFERLNATL
jgi:mannose-1-phosphate guanylyltransferase